MGELFEKAALSLSLSALAWATIVVLYYLWCSFGLFLLSALRS